jgi:hypothetical protein
MTELPSAVWRRSLRCVSDHHCVEVADFGDAVGLRNSQHPEHSLTISTQAWQNFLDELKAGDFRVEQN